MSIDCSQPFCLMIIVCVVGLNHYVTLRFQAQIGLEKALG